MPLGPGGACRAKAPSGKRRRIQGASRGFRWGDVHEWTGEHVPPLSGLRRPGPWQRLFATPAICGAEHTKVLRGASFATRPALRSARLRGFAPPARDDGFFGFRSCAP